MRTRTSIPSYELYGESRDSGVTGFLHVERIRVRASLHAWNISAHQHGAFSQAFFVSSGSGVLLIEGRSVAFDTPAMFWIPARTVHGFAFAADTDGAVVTVSAEFLNTIIEMQLGRENGMALREVILAMPPGDAIGIDIPACFQGLEREAGLGGPGARQAAASYLSLVLLALLRSTSPRVPGSAGRTSGLFHRFRDLVELHFRAHWSMSRYASALGVSADRLHEAVQRVSGRAPTQIVQERLLLEAKRALVFTTVTISEIAYELGFEDPAYFTRFFSRNAGCSPLAFRRNPDQASGKSNDASP